MAEETARWLGNRVPPSSCCPSPRSTSEVMNNGISRELLQLLEPAGSALDIPAEQDEPADALFDERFDFVSVRRVLKGRSVNARHYHLGDRSFQFGHGGHFLFFTMSLQVFFPVGTTFAVDKTLHYTIL